MAEAASEAIRDVGDESATTQTTSRRPNPMGEKDLPFDVPPCRPVSSSGCSA